MLLSATLAVMVTMVVGQDTTASSEPRKCCYDRQFSMLLGEIGDTFDEVTQTNKFLDGGVLVGYDFYRRREGKVTYLRQPDDSFTTRYDLYDFANGIEYYKIGNDSCHSFPLQPRNERTSCIPQHAKFLGHSVLGYGGSSMRINQWELVVPRPVGGNYVFKISVSEDQCIPVYEEVMGTTRNGTFFEVSYFITQYHPGIQDVHSLDIPANCTPGDNPGSPSLGLRR